MSHRANPPTYDGDTKTAVLDVSAKLFALKGFKGVTLKEIAKAVGIRLASLYYYYNSKEELIADVLLRFEKAHKRYNEWLRRANENAKTLEEVMDNLFNDNFLGGLDTAGRLGLSLIVKEQHNSESAYQALCDTFYRDAIQNITDGFDRLIEEKVIPPSDTKTMASLLVFFISAINDLHIHEAVDTETPVDRGNLYAGFRTMMTAALSQGILKSAE